MRRNKDVTLTDVAREVGVSTMTVSAVLNGSKSTVRVSEQTSIRVREAAKRMCYGVPRIGSSPVKRRTNSIGIVAEFNHPGNLNMVLLQLLDGIFEACVVSGQRTVVYPVTMWSTDEKHVLGFCDGSVDGYIFLAPRLSPETARHFYRAAPIVAVHNAGSIAGALNIDINNELGAYIATKHLIDLGHKRIAHVSGGPARSGTDERVNGYQRALSDAGLDLRPEYELRGFYSLASGIDCAEQFITRFPSENRPTAVFCANDSSACGFIGGLRARGLRVPEDVSVIGFDDGPIACLPVLELTTIRQPLRSIGVHAVSILLKTIDRMAGESDRTRDVVLVHNRSEYYRDIEGIQVKNNESLIFEPRLIVRKTTAPLSSKSR